MYLQKDTAAKIIEEISMILDYDLNIMDEKGAILASTDPSRVGMFHEGAWRIIRYHLKELCIYEDGQYHGCRKGINLPVFLNDQIIGVIGITGEVAEVMKYAKVLKKMTEILVLDLFSYHKKSQQEQALLFFINEWVNKEPAELLPAFRDELHSYGFSENAPFAVALVTPGQILQDAEPPVLSSCLCSCRGDVGVVICSTSQTEKLASFLKTSAQNAGQETFLASVGSVQPDYTGVKRSYNQARKLLTVKQGESGIFFYDNSTAELIFHDVLPEYKEALIRQLLPGFTEEEMVEFADFMNAYVQNNGSIGQIAKQLFVHKNTVQYKINKILRQTGKDPRVIQDVILLNMVAGWIRRP